ncbi:hypothetical protein BB561_001894 [Smittium simulii]|uniref:Uncharacterized protein n=1 Tax=Smittium simulii TaxID=133385 RepID=A0A2T9YSP1_9FUNG|nr:hypothetical protein BB561_001894 [Smittium simulii]
MSKESLDQETDVPLLSVNRSRMATSLYSASTGRVWQRPFIQCQQVAYGNVPLFSVNSNATDSSSNTKRLKSKKFNQEGKARFLNRTIKFVSSRGGSLYFEPYEQSLLTID